MLLRVQHSNQRRQCMIRCDAAQVQTTSARNIFTGLTPGVVYDAVVNVVGSAGPSDWTDPVAQMAV